MKKFNTYKRILLLCLIFTFSGCTSTPAPLSMKPEMQTAPWAQKWWLPRHEDKIALKESMKRVDLVFLGDSITHAWDNKGKAVWDSYYGKRNALNIGFSGDRTENVLWRLNHGAVDKIDPKLVVLMIGTNNTGHRQDKPQDTADGIKAIIANLEGKLPNTTILLLAIFPRGAEPDNPFRKINDDINNIIKTYHDGERVFYRDINNVFLDEQGVLSKSIMTDLLHPNKAQYLVWAKAVEPQIKKLMSE